LPHPLQPLALPPSNNTPHQPPTTIVRAAAQIVRRGKDTSCFIEFFDVPSSVAVHASQQGAILSSSERGGIRIQFSKNPFGKKRDFEGNAVKSEYGGGPGGGGGGGGPPGGYAGHPPPLRYA